LKYGREIERLTALAFSAMFHDMATLTQYGRIAEKHWREHLPKMVQELEAKGQLQEKLLEAEEKTLDEMREITRRVLKRSIYTAQQAEDTAWTIIREKYILLPPEEASSERGPSVR
jgi:hypothetical protein